MRKKKIRIKIKKKAKRVAETISTHAPRFLFKHL